jgi:hypothetical protein
VDDRNAQQPVIRRELGERTKPNRLLPFLVGHGYGKMRN